MRKNVRKALAGAMAGVMLLQSPMVAFADSEKVVTLGADLTQAQKDAMMEYFGANKDEVTVIEVNNQEERKYLEGIATSAEIGTHTYSCAYINPTNSGQINVKTAHLTWVSTSMIANTLVTAGIDSCDVIAAAPRDVSGTGALTGIIKAYEKVTDEELNEEKTELAMKELYETAQLGQDVGQDEASAIMNEVKKQVIKEGITDANEVQDVVDEVSDYYDVELTEAQKKKVSELMSQIGEQDYDYNKIEGTMDDLQDKLVGQLDGVSESFEEGTKGFFASIGDFFAGIFKAIGDFFAGLFGGGSDDADSQEESILDDTNDQAIGVESTEEPSSQDADSETSGDVNTDTDTTENTPDSATTDSEENGNSSIDDAVNDNTANVDPFDDANEQTDSYTVNDDGTVG